MFKVVLFLLASSLGFAQELSKEQIIRVSEKLIKDKNLHILVKNEPGELFVHEGASSIDLEPIYDNSSLVYIKKLNSKFLDYWEYIIVEYPVNGEDPRLHIGAIDEANNLYLSSSKEATIVYPFGYGDEKIMNDLKRIGILEKQVQIFSGMDMATLRLPEEVFIGKVLILLSNLPEGANIELNNFNYRVPFRFEPLKKVEKVNFLFDSYRTFTKELKLEGKKFTPGRTKFCNLILKKS
jgi:hypothetical protein